MHGHGLSTDLELCYGVMGGDGAFVLFDLLAPLDQDEMEAAKERGLFYCGALGVKDGEAEARVEPHPDCAGPMIQAALAFACIVAGRLTLPGKAVKSDGKGDEVAWLESLYALEVPRA